MLIDFSFSNKASFRDEQAFSMSRDKRFFEPWEPDVSSIAAVYGANASGKSNFLSALYSMRNMVVTSYSSGDGASLIPREPFLLRQNPSDHDSMYYAEFVAKDLQRYRYWFRFDDHVIREEELAVYRLTDEASGRLSTHPSRLFRREDSKIEFGPSFRGPKAQVSKTIELRTNALALSACAAAGIACTQAAFEFFFVGFAYCQGDSFGQEYPFILQQFNQKNDFAKKIARLVRYADFGIFDVKSKLLAVDDSAWAQAKHNLAERLSADESKFDQLFTKPSQTRLGFEHRGNGVEAILDMDRESHGTLAALAFFSMALKVLSQPTVLLMDEIDTSLHPTLVRELISLFTDSMTNPHGSQLIFTTHDTSLINTTGTVDRLIDPDQVWLVEKNGDGSSEIYPVTDLKVRKGENIGKNYLNGVYGGVPRPTFHEAFAAMLANDPDERSVE